MSLSNKLDQSDEGDVGTGGVVEMEIKILVRGIKTKPDSNHLMLFYREFVPVCAACHCSLKTSFTRHHLAADS